jgi:hypothetical protein
VLERLERSVAAIGKAQASVEIVNMPPPAVHELLEKQIAIVETLLVPMLRSMGHNMQGQAAVWDRLTEILAELKRVDRATLANVHTVHEIFRPFDMAPADAAPVKPAAAGAKPAAPAAPAEPREPAPRPAAPRAPGQPRPTAPYRQVPPKTE